MKEDLLTPAQFEVVAKVLRSKDPARRAAYMVLVEGATQNEAIAATNMHQSAVSRSLKRFVNTHALILTGYPVAKRQKSP